MFSKILQFVSCRCSIHIFVSNVYQYIFTERWSSFSVPCDETLRFRRRFPLASSTWTTIGLVRTDCRYICIDLKDCRHCTETPSSHLDSATCCTGIPAHNAGCILFPEWIFTAFRRVFVWRVRLLPLDFLFRFLHVPRFVRIFFLTPPRSTFNFGKSVCCTAICNMFLSSTTWFVFVCSVCVFVVKLQYLATRRWRREGTSLIVVHDLL